MKAGSVAEKEKPGTFIVIGAENNTHRRSIHTKEAIRPVLLDKFDLIFQQILRAHLICAPAETYHSKTDSNQIAISSRKPDSLFGILLDHKYRLLPNTALFHDGAEQHDPHATYPLGPLSAELYTVQFYQHNVVSLIRTILCHFHHIINDYGPGPRPLCGHVEHKQKEVMEVGRYNETKDPLAFAPNLYRHDLDPTQTLTWAIIYNGLFLERSSLYSRIQEAKALCNRLTFNDVRNSCHVEGSEAVAAANIPLPPDSEHDFPNVRVPLTQHLTHLGCLSDFRTAFIAAMRGHHRFFLETGFVHGGLTPHNLRFMESATGVGITGVFVDLDPLDSTLDGLMDEPLSVPFQAYDLFNNHNAPRHYRHDLESFFHILVWYAFCNTISTEGRMTTRQVGAKYNDRWFAITWNALGYHDYRYSEMKTWRTRFLRDCDSEFRMITESFKDLEDTWLRPLWSMFSKAHMQGIMTSTNLVDKTVTDHLTFETFMAAINSSV